MDVKANDLTAAHAVTDLIDKNKIMSVTVTPADKQKYTSKATVITLKNDVIDA